MNFLPINPLRFQSGPFDWYTRLESPVKIKGLARRRKYQLTKEIVIELPKACFRDLHDTTESKVSILGRFMAIRPDFAFDGASGPALDLHTNMLAALVHDALYYLKAHGYNGFSYAQADALYRDIMIAQGASRIRATAHYIGLRGFAWIWRLF